MLGILTSGTHLGVEAVKADLESMLREALSRRDALASDLGRADEFIAVITDRMAS
ncbi:hypothetical protein [Arthrobacter sp. ISL-95]|uniref:hypothetical protein n=1 Tax=Arthrobacter sp. ISL-95 TaxID=2819116 RepID=UPI002852F2C3|nr:hypothetical protein [Arthrobacter sp. ISL-95]